MQTWNPTAYVTQALTAHSSSVISCEPQHKLIQPWRVKAAPGDFSSTWQLKRVNSPKSQKNKCDVWIIRSRPTIALNLQRTRRKRPDFASESPRFRTFGIDVIQRLISVRYTQELLTANFVNFTANLSTIYVCKRKTKKLGQVVAQSIVQWIFLTVMERSAESEGFYPRTPTKDWSNVQYPPILQRNVYQVLANFQHWGNDTGWKMITNKLEIN